MAWNPKGADKIVVSHLNILDWRNYTRLMVGRDWKYLVSQVMNLVDKNLGRMSILVHSVRSTMVLLSL